MVRLLSPDNKIVKAKTVAELARRYNLNVTSLYKVAQGIQAGNLGWMSLHPRHKKRLEEVQTLLIHVPTRNVEHVGFSYKRFARKHDLNNEMLSDLIRGKRISYCGWMLKKTYDKLQTIKTTVQS
jgi:hypothetical protein